jgi:hypothetical protein
MVVPLHDYDDDDRNKGKRKTNKFQESNYNLELLVKSSEYTSISLHTSSSSCVAHGVWYIGTMRQWPSVSDWYGGKQRYT